jgi:hypothetical protein
MLSNAVHTLIALSLLGELGQVDGILVTHFVGVGSLRRGLLSAERRNSGLGGKREKTALGAVARAKCEADKVDVGAERWNDSDESR